MATDMMTQLATLVQGGMPPAQAIQYLRDAQAQEFAKMPLEQQLAANVGKYAGRVGQGLLRAAGVEDPMLAQASKMRDLSTQFDTSTAEGMMQYAKALQSVNPAMAQQAAMKARDMALTEAKITSEQALATQRGREKEAADPKAKFISANADKFTPDSLQTFMDSGKYSDLKPLTKEEKGVKPPADFLTVAVELGFGEKDKIGSYSSEQVKAINQTLTDRHTRKASAGATNVQVGIPGIGGAIAKKQGEAAGTEGGKVVGKDAAQIQGKEDALTAVRSARELVKSGIYSGGYGPMQEAVAKYTPIGSKARVANTEQFRSTIGEVVLPRLQEFGGNDSNEELKYLRAIAGGETTFERATLERVLESAERKIQRGIKRIQDQQKAVQEGKPLPTDVAASPAAPAAAPRATKRFNPQTGAIEPI
jgi:hypothetical protein